MKPHLDSPSAPTRLTTSEASLLLVVLVVCRCLAIWAFPIYDDAFITYRYAENLATGLGMVFNPGAPWEPVLGTTTPGYAVLLAGFRALGLDMVTVSLTINIVCDAISAFWLMHLIRYRLVASAVAILAFACVPEIARISVGGMEPPVLVMCALTAVAAYQARWTLSSGLAAAVACTMRPEAVLLVGILGALQLREPRRLVRFMVPVAVVGALSMGTLWYVYGSPVSQSVQAKAEAHAVHDQIERAFEILSNAFGPSIPMRLVLTIVVLGMWRSIARRVPLLPFLGFTTAMVTAYLIVRPKTWGWYYYAPLVAWTAWLGIGTEKLVDWIGQERIGLISRRRLRWITIALSLFALGGVTLYSRLRPDRVTPLVYDQMEAWAREARLEEDGATVLASDIGAIGFLGRARVLDAKGLVWPEALDIGGPVDVIREHRPDFVMLVAIRTRVEPFVTDPELREVYRPIRRFNVRNETGLEHLKPDPKLLPYWWRQDYIVYERVGPPREEPEGAPAEPEDGSPQE